VARLTSTIQTLEDCRELILNHEREYREGKALGCLLVFQEKLVGMCELSKIVPLLRKAEIGYWIAEEYEGKGIVSQSCRDLIVYAFGTMKLNRLALKFKHVSDDNENIRSRRVAKRLGFTQEGILRQDGMTKGQIRGDGSLFMS
jgi:ribosomal-protein-serine acetyltransferase